MAFGTAPEKDARTILNAYVNHIGKVARAKEKKPSGQANSQKIQDQCWNCGENRSPIEGLLGKAAAAAPIEPRTIASFLEAKRRERQVW